MTFVFDPVEQEILMNRGWVLSLLLCLFLPACTSNSPVYDLDRTSEWDQQVRGTLESSSNEQNQTPYGKPVEQKREKKEVGRGDTVQLSGLVDRALRENQGVQSAEQRWKSAVYRAGHVSGLPDPELMTMAAVEPIKTRDGPVDWQLRLSQKFPWFGKLDAKEQQQLAEAGKWYSRYLRKRNKVVRNVKETFAEYRYLFRAIEITEEMREYLDRMEEGVRQRYESGASRVHDLLRIENEREKLETERADLEDRKQAVRANMNELLDRPSDAELAEPDRSRSGFPELNRKDLLAKLRKHRPQIEEARFRGQSAQQQLRSARLGYYPDFRVGMSYSVVGDTDKPGTVDAGSDAYGVQMTLELPLWQGKRDARFRAARADKRAARRELAQEKNHAEAQLTGVMSEFEQHRRRVRLHSDTIVPNAKRSLSSAREAYETGDMDIVSFLDFQDRLLRARLEHQRAVADQLKAFAELEEMIGVALNFPKEEK